MVKPEWGTKRTCPKCSTRFYDLGKDDPVHCINCATDFMPEPVLKSKQPLAFEAAPVAAKEPAQDDELAAEDEDVADYVRALEETRDTADLPEASGEAIAREFERYLKRRDTD